jgi:outer membrane protein OmpA-like peptidoglycan-associated protein
VTAGKIGQGMRVLDHRGTALGKVDAIDVDRLCVMRRGVHGPEEHWLPLASVEWVDHAVHLREEGRSGEGARPARTRRRYWLLAIAGLGAAGLVGIMAASAMRGDDDTPRRTAGGVALPGGSTVDVAPGSVAEDMQRFLASPAAAPRMFTLRALEFDEGKLAIPSAAAGEVKELARVLAAYPRARVEVVGYADLPKNVAVAVDVQAAAEIGRRRARALADALIAAGVSDKAVVAVSGNDPLYLDSLTPAPKDGDDRHPDLIVTRK